HEPPGQPVIPHWFCIGAGATKAAPPPPPQYSIDCPQLIHLL
ncbi:unnamed protein product, partial [Rotaria socialis]